MSEWVWMPHAGHFVLGDRCRFRLATYVNGVIVSTVGELESRADDGTIERVGSERLYETMVFKATAGECPVCPYTIAGDELDFAPYNTDRDAYAGHLALCRKWDERGLSEDPAG